jgi:hypothetical protein
MTKECRLFLMNYWLVAYLRAVLLMYHHRLPSPAPLLASQMICLWSTDTFLYYLWFTYDHLWITYITYALLIIYLWSTYDLLRLLMMSVAKKKKNSLLFICGQCTGFIRAVSSDVIQFLPSASLKCMSSSSESPKAEPYTVDGSF